MQTAKADVQNTVNGLRQNSRILLDSGSQRTYITESLVKRLHFKLEDKDEFMLVTFGSEKPKRTESRNTKLDIVLKNESKVGLLWLEQFWDHKNMFETGVVRANEC